MFLSVSWLTIILLALCARPQVACAGTTDSVGRDWPMWRYDQRRSAHSTHDLPDDLHLHWARQLPAPRRAWPEQMDDYEKLAFDASYEPVAAAGMLFVPSMVEDRITAYSLETGEVIWQHWTDGPVRMAPLFWEGRLYAAADDGRLYCLDARTGAPVWVFDAAPGNRLVLGNERLISLWPARGGPVIADGVLYFAAGLWPHEGVFVYALEARTAELRWVNSGSPADLIVDSKRYYSFGGVAPQGQLAVQGDQLFVPGGRTAPAVFDRHTGDMLFFNVATHTTTKGAGGHTVFARDEWFFNVRDHRVTHMYSTVDGAQYDAVPVALTTGDALIGVDAQQRIVAFAPELEPTGEQPPEPQVDRYGQPLIDGRPDASSRAPGVSERLSRRALSRYYDLRERWASDPVDGLQRLHLKAGSTLIGSGADGRIMAVREPAGKRAPRVLWEKRVSGQVFSILAAHDRLVVVTQEGWIFCFGPGERRPEVFDYAPRPLYSDGGSWSHRARELLREVDPRGGYALMFGAGTGRLLEELVRQSELHFTVFDPDSSTVARLRRRFRDTGLYGERVAVHVGDVHSHRLPPYIASLIVSEDPDAAGLGGGDAAVRALFHSLRPYGGMAYVRLDGNHQERFAMHVDHAGLEQAALRFGDDHALLVRSGTLPGAASWTHQYADAGNTAYSPDRRVRAPLGIAWFGGEPNHKALPRHMNGPIPQVIDGRLFLLGPHHVSARCVYTGVELWATELIRVGERFTSEEEAYFREPAGFPNQPGANFTGSPMASAHDGIYVLHEDRCLRLDPETGRIIASFELPDRAVLARIAREATDHDAADPNAIEQDAVAHDGVDSNAVGKEAINHNATEQDAVAHDVIADGGAIAASYGTRIQDGEPLAWGHIRYSGNHLIAAAYPHMYDDRLPGRENNWNATSSEFVVVMDRHDGRIQWVRQARYGFRHNAIVAGNGLVFAIDHLSSEVRDRLARRGIEPAVAPRILAWDLATGQERWTYDEEVFGTALAYSEPHDVLLQSGHPGRRRALPDEPRDRLLVLRGETGKMLWERTTTQRRSPVGLHAGWGQIIGSTGEGALDMHSGERLQRLHPVTARREYWAWLGALRCGTQNYSEHLVTFRSGAAGFTDLSGGAMTGNITGFRPGCTNNLIVADGMLNAPEYSRSCACSYQHQTSLGLVHMPGNEMWSYSGLSDPGSKAVLRAGVNFGAPGNRLDADRSILWVEYPVRVGPAPELDLTVQTAGELDLFRQHSAWIRNPQEEYAWVAAYGIMGVEHITLTLVPPDPEMGNRARPGEVARPDGEARSSRDAGHDGDARPSRDAPTRPEPRLGRRYDVTLIFAEPEDVAPGQRVFDVLVQGDRVARDLDIVERAGGYRRTYRLRLPGISVDSDLRMDFVPREGSMPPVISGVEVIAAGSVEPWCD